MGGRRVVKRLAGTSGSGFKRDMEDFSIGDGRWLPHRYVEGGDAIRFRWFDRDHHRAVTFLSAEEVGDGTEVERPRTQCLAWSQGQKLPPPRLILHSAFCCSTMLVRGFDQPGLAMGLSEPQILNDIAGLALRRGDRRQVAAAMDAALHLLARPLAPHEAVVVKPSNVVNPLAPLIMALRPGTRLLLLHAPIETFVASVARKEIEGRLWIRELVWKHLSLGLLARFGLSDEEVFRLTDLQVAALGWLGQQALFADLARSHPAKVRTLNSEVLTAAPPLALAALGRHFAIALDAEAVAAGPAFTRHSKDGREFDAGARAAERAAGEQRHARELEVVLRWAAKMAEHAEVAMTLPGSLLD